MSEERAEGRKLPSRPRRQNKSVNPSSSSIPPSFSFFFLLFCYNLFFFTSTSSSLSFFFFLLLFCYNLFFFFLFYYFSTEISSSSIVFVAVREVLPAASFCRPPFLLFLLSRPFSASFLAMEFFFAELHRCPKNRAEGRKVPSRPRQRNKSINPCNLSTTIFFSLWPWAASPFINIALLLMLPLQLFCRALFFILKPRASFLLLLAASSCLSLSKRFCIVFCSSISAKCIKHEERVITTTAVLSWKI